MFSIQDTGGLRLVLFHLVQFPHTCPERILRSKSNSAFWSVEPTDFKNVILENIPPALSEVAEVAKVKQSRNPKWRKFYYEKS
jgi:hypothetical protein